MPEQFETSWKRLRQRFRTFQRQPNHFPIHCALVNAEESQAKDIPAILYRLLGNVCYKIQTFAGNGRCVSTVFRLPDPDIGPSRLQTRVWRLVDLANEAQRLLGILPLPIQQRLVLPSEIGWWQSVFHLSWHFPRAIPAADRLRCYSDRPECDGPIFWKDETAVQLAGLSNCREIWPGLLYSAIDLDICEVSSAAIDVIIDALRADSSKTAPIVGLTPSQHDLFQDLRGEFEKVIGLSAEVKLLKLTGDLRDPPALEWASFENLEHDRHCCLSRLGGLQEYCLVSGPATDRFVELAETAGAALPRDLFPDRPIILTEVQPAMCRSNAARWLGFILSTLNELKHVSFRLNWPTELGPQSYGYATLDRNLFAASVLAIDLAILLRGPLNVGDTQPMGGKEASRRSLPTKNPQKMKEPSQEAFAAYQIHKQLGYKQSKIAELLTQQYKKPFSQGVVSKLINAVRLWHEATIGLTDPPETRRKPSAMDPSKLDMGSRDDGHAPRQRQRKNDGG